MMKTQCVEIEYENVIYDVFISLKTMEVDEIWPHDSDVNIIDVMDQKVIKWMEEKAIEEIEEENQPISNFSCEYYRKMDELGLRDRDFA